MAKLDGYTLTERMRKIRRKHPLTASEQAVFHELVAICNEDSWADVFTCSNNDLFSPLQISENTLEKSRNRLIQVGLIFYKSGKSRRVYGQYSFTKKFEKEKTTSKTTSDFEVDKGMDKGVDSEVDKGVDSSDIIKEQTKTKTETKLKDSFSPSANPAKKETAKFWDKLVDGGFGFSKEKFSTEPTFKGEQAKQLKIIVETIERATLKAGKEYTEDFAMASLLQFITLAYSDQWLKDHFLLKNLCSQFDSIIQKRKNGTNQTGQPATGGNVSTSSIFNAINAMPD